MLVGGGGGGGGYPSDDWGNGGGGGGGVVIQRNFEIPEGEYVISVGNGGAGSGNGSPNYYGYPGGDTYLQYGPHTHNMWGMIMILFTEHTVVEEDILGFPICRQAI